MSENHTDTRSVLCHFAAMAVLTNGTPQKNVKFSEDGEKVVEGNDVD